MFTMMQIEQAQRADHDLFGCIGRTNLESGNALLYRFLGMRTPVGLGASSIGGGVGQPHVDALRQRCERLEVWMCHNGDDVRHSIALPNEWRLSCGASWTISQTDGLHRKTAPPASGAC